MHVKNDEHVNVEIEYNEHVKNDEHVNVEINDKQSMIQNPRSIGSLLPSGDTTPKRVQRARQK